MGTSNWRHLPYCIEVLMNVNPQKVLDVGVGFGRWGAMTREFCELWQERIFPHTWKIQVEGIEAFPDQLGSWQKAFYNRIHIGDARQLLGQLPGPWDIVIFGDVLEHFKRDEALEALRIAMEKASYVLVNISIGARFKGLDRQGNPYDAHLSLWDIGDFKLPEARSSRLGLDSFGRTYLSVVLSNNDPKELSEKLGLQWDLNHEPQRLAEARSHSLEEAKKLWNRFSSTGRELAIARQRLRFLESRTESIESSLTWRLMKFCGRTGLLAVPYACIQLWRRLISGTQPIPAIATSGATNPSLAAGMPTAAASPAIYVPPASGNGSAKEDEPLEFNLPTAITSQAFAEMLKMRPVSFRNVFHAPALMSPQERVLMYCLAFALAPQRYLEIGTCFGGSAVLVTAAMDDLNKGRAFGVDPNPSISQKSLDAISHRFTLIRGSSPQALDRAQNLAGGAFDLILIDGDHSFESTLDDLRGAMTVAASDAVILVHDAYNEEVNRAIAAFLEAQSGKIADGGILATSRNPIIENNCEQDWGGLRLLRVCCGAHVPAKSLVMEESGRV